METRNAFASRLKFTEQRYVLRKKKSGVYKEGKNKLEDTNLQNFGPDSYLSLMMMGSIASWCLPEYFARDFFLFYFRHSQGQTA